MTSRSAFVKRLNIYNYCLKLFDCANYVYLDEISNFEFKKISKYTKSKYLFDKIIRDFKLVNELIDNNDLLNAATILRTLYENIIYIIAKTYDTSLDITINVDPKKLRRVLENNCNDIFTDYFDKNDFNSIYSHLCKIVHPSSMKELLSYMIKTVKYKEYLLINLKYTMLVIEYMYLNFLNKKIGNDESNFDLNFIDLCSYVNLVNVINFLNEAKNSKTFIKRYFYYDIEHKYVVNKQSEIKETFEILLDNKVSIDSYVKDLATTLETQIKNSKYNEVISNILKIKKY